ncbi:uncharacterized peptidase C1-like protein F26E4.3 [Asterias rubens]|uniref:uncharacterized peptidase C1-like protein F26E4.3 n=1 Tax=Asterias rubens TaxID=7604 RepID=UPI001455970D|nr:uncharacterized peptidase C1-like protein F26E4.3 [Asterias rubens]XP_033644923.1 uncharacterized peptidase C1-like protein F26E4.3 [Asterias rubens]XP_033644924.1 uncharacterized peptidase C1-like protein F26E4.3 [Asterias rubens]XP_033644925.1 uncharacterized peptidase C1-like protein F26E4.3 [Asterias rubens]XP_033644926.1 uncharacterized peptidase C1-like protein F26E4.3 [Asterias rubens]
MDTTISATTHKSPLAVLFVFTLVFSTSMTPAQSQFCSDRPGGCCPGRDDACTVPRGDTLCYCDEFCLRSKDPDCCPDVFNNCTALPVTVAPLSPNPLKSDCLYKGKHYFAGDSIKINCNTCTCLLDVGGYELQCEDKVCLIREEIINAVNSDSNGWLARNYTFLWGLTLEEGVRRRLGTLKPAPFVAGMKEIAIEQMEDLPESFDSRQKWPGWIEDVMDQGNCGSSWAVSTTSVASDRLAIQSMGNMKLPLSAQNLLSCNTRRQRGCDGGHLDRAWYYVRKYGVVTDKCYPYKSGMDESSKMERYPCMLPRHQSTPCPHNDTTSGKYHSSPPYRISEKESDIKAEIFKNGPVQATFLVKDDFYSYAGGVYKYTREAVKGASKGKLRSGYHSVRIIGWGVDRTNPSSSLPYWICANSWGTQWGENGLFRIIRGQNECGIESFIVGVWGDIDMEMMRH